MSARTGTRRLSPLPPLVVVLALALAMGLFAGWRVAEPLVAAPAEMGSASSVPAQDSAPVVPFAALPVLNLQGQDDFCRTWVSVANVGSAPTRAVMVAWGKETVCSGDCRAPLGVECSGLIQPGGAWQFLGAQIPSFTASAAVFSFNDRRLTEIAPGLGVDDRAADYLCERLFFDLSGCGAYAQFKAAADAGGEFAGVPLAAAAGSPLAVTVLRHCSGDTIPGTEVSASYEAVASANGYRRDARGAYLSYAAPVAGRAAPGPVPGGRIGTYLYIQNAGSRCALVEVWLKSWADACAAPELCRTVEVAPGAAARVAVADCVDDGWQGGAWVRSPDPVALVVETVGQDVGTVYTGVPVGSAGDVTGAPGVATAATEAYAPLVDDPASGWTSTVVVQNLGETAGRARVTFVDQDGNLLGRQEGELCPQGSRAFELPASGYELAEAANSARVESLPMMGGEPAPVSAVLVATGRAAADGSPVAGYAYNLLPAALSLASPESGSGGGGTAGGVGVIAVPSAPTDLAGVGVTTELAVQNLVSVAGETDVAVLLYDRNDLVATRCRTLGAREVAYLDLGAAGITPSGLLGDAVVSATAWRHPEPGSGRNLLGLAAVAVHRTGVGRGIDIPGDEVAVTAGIPLRQPPTRPAAGADDCPAPAPPPLPPPPGDPATPANGIVFLPVLDYQGQDDVCQTIVEVTNASDGPGKALLVVYGQPGFCPPQCVGPEGVFCSGLLAPGASWRLDTASLGFEFDRHNGVLFGFNDSTLADLGVPGGDETLAADWLCTTGLPKGDCDATRRMNLAYSSGGRFQNVPMAAAFAAPFTASVERTCPDVEQPGVAVSSRYDGLSGAHFDPTRSVAGGYWQSAVPVYADEVDQLTILYLQNAGLSCAGVTIAFQALGECQERQVCVVFALAPGEAYEFDATDCVGPSWAGTAYIRSEAPLAIAADIVAPSVLTSWSAEPIWSPYDLNADGAVDDADVAVLAAAEGSTPGAANWYPRADLNHDDEVSWPDRVLLLRGGLCREVPTPTLTPSPTAGTPTTEPTTAIPTATPSVTATATPTSRPPRWRIYLPLAVTPRR